MTPAARTRAVATPRAVRGVTLMELMIVLAIASIMAAIAYPMYRDYVLEARRSAAESAMMDVATAQEAYFIDTKIYADTTADLDYPDPIVTEGGHYQITVIAAVTDADGFTLQAVPQGSQADDQCATLTISSTGRKTPAGCW